MIELEKRGKNSKLWVSYIRMDSILKDHIAAERMGDWELYLRTTNLMIPYFHAAGYFNYAKSAQIYVQDMLDLRNKMNPEVFTQFTTNGFFTAIRTDKFFSGIFSDQTIEQTLMKAMKVNGGTFKRGVTESIVYKWIKGVIHTKDVIEGIEDFCGVSFKKNFQHEDATDARIKRDNDDFKKIEEFFVEHNPFKNIEEIFSIASGVTGDRETVIMLFQKI